jgi:dipeptidyl aminopeptidase/acylaminoacyl peptidase
MPLVVSSCSDGDGALPCSDGDRIVTTAASGESGWHRQLVLTDGHGRHAEPITPEDGNAEAPTFSPDGERVAYAAGRGDYESAGPSDPTIWTVGADGSDRTRITGPDGWAESGMADYEWSDHDPDWSPTRDEIVYSHTAPYPPPLSTNVPDTRPDRHGLFVVVPGEAPRRLTESGGTLMFDDRPAWSPDGNQVAFVRHEADMSTPGDPPGLWVVDRDGSNARRIVDLTSGNDALRWSPDGAAIVLGGDWPGGSRGRGLSVFRSIDVTTGVSTELGPPLAAFAWSADGARLYAVSGRDGELVVTHLDDDPPTFEERAGEDDEAAIGREFDLTACT